MNALYSEAREHLEQAKLDERELEELRELKADVERKEKQQAAIIEHQVGAQGRWWACELGLGVTRPCWTKACLQHEHLSC